MKWKCRNADSSINCLKNRLKEFQDKPHTYTYQNLIEAVMLFLEHVKRGSKIVIHGDYDADGINALNIFKTLCRALKITNVSIVAPCRFNDGYGLKTEHSMRYIKEGADLLITVDNGIAAIEAIRVASEKMDVIVLDHHEAYVEFGEVILPNATVIVDPHITGGIRDDGVPFDDLCGAGIALKFAECLIQKVKFLSDEAKENLINELTVFAAIATVADLVSLTEDNRLIVKKGLKLMNERHMSAGLKALVNACSLEKITSTDIAFTLGPIINACGRIQEYGAQKVVNILTATEYSEELESQVRELISINDTRKELTKEVTKELLKTPFVKDNFILATSDTCGIGFAGLVAAALVEEFNKPAVVLCKVDENTYKGSGRSIDGFDLKAALDDCQNSILAYGGHPAACGLTVSKDNILPLREALNSITPESDTSETVCYYDCEIPFNEDNLKEILSIQEGLEPFGMDNPKLVIRFNDIKLGNSLGNYYAFMGKNAEHLKLITPEANIVWFGGKEAFNAMGKPRKVNVFAGVGLNWWKGKSSIQLQAIDITS